MTHCLSVQAALEKVAVSDCSALDPCLPLQAAKERHYWKEMSDASLERIRTTYTWCAQLPLLSQRGIQCVTPSA